MTVKRKRLSPAFRKAFQVLADDPSPKIREALLEELRQAGEEALDFLHHQSVTLSRWEAIAARHYLEALARDHPTVEGLDFIRSMNYELETGLLILTKAVSPELNHSEFCFKLDQIAARARELFSPPMSVREKCQLLNRVFFHEHGFRLVRRQEEDTSLLLPQEVLYTKRGGAFALMLLYALIADRCRLTLETVKAPGHFLLGCYEGKEPFFVDVYASGSLRWGSEVLTNLQKEDAGVSEMELAPTPVGEILKTYCHSLNVAFAREGRVDESRLFERFRKEFAEIYRRHAQS